MSETIQGTVAYVAKSRKGMKIEGQGDKWFNADQPFPPFVKKGVGVTFDLVGDKVVFNGRFFSSGDSRDPEMAGTGGSGGSNTGGKPGGFYKDPETQRSIMRQSSLQRALEFSIANKKDGDDLTVEGVINVAMIFTDYVSGKREKMMAATGGSSVGIPTQELNEDIPF